MEERAGRGNNDTVLSKLLDGSLNGLNSALEVGLPDITSINDTGREDSLRAQCTNDGLKLLWVSD